MYKQLYMISCISVSSAYFMKKVPTYSVHSFNEVYLSIPEGPGSWNPRYLKPHYYLQLNCIFSKKSFDFIGFTLNSSYKYQNTFAVRLRFFLYGVLSVLLQASSTPHESSSTNLRIKSCSGKADQVGMTSSITGLLENAHIQCYSVLWFFSIKNYFAEFL